MMIMIKDSLEKSHVRKKDHYKPKTKVIQVRQAVIFFTRLLDVFSSEL